MIVIHSDSTCLLKLEPFKTRNRWINFIHAEFLEWNKENKRKLKEFLDSIGESYALSNNQQLTKFALLNGGKIVGKTDFGKIIRLN